MASIQDPPAWNANPQTGGPLYSALPGIRTLTDTGLKSVASPVGLEAPLLDPYSAHLDLGADITPAQGHLHVVQLDGGQLLLPQLAA